MAFIFYINRQLEIFSDMVGLNPNVIFNLTFTSFWIAFLISALWTAAVLTKTNIPTNFYELLVSKKVTKNNSIPILNFSLFFWLTLLGYIIINSIKILIALGKEAAIWYNYFEKNGFILANYSKLNLNHESAIVNLYLDITDGKYRTGLHDSAWATKSLGLGNGWGWDFLIPATSDFVGIVQLYLIIMTVLVTVSVSVAFMFKFSATDRVDQTVNLFKLFGDSLVRSPEYIVTKKYKNDNTGKEYKKNYIVFNQAFEKKKPDWYLESLNKHLETYEDLGNTTILKSSLSKPRTIRSIRKIKKIFSSKTSEYRTKAFNYYSSVEEGLLSSQHTTEMRGNREFFSKYTIPAIYRSSSFKKIKNKKKVKLTPTARIVLILKSIKEFSIPGKLFFAVPKAILLNTIRKITKEKPIRKLIRLSCLRKVRKLFHLVKVPFIKVWKSFNSLEYTLYSLFETSFYKSIERTALYKSVFINKDPNNIDNILKDKDDNKVIELLNEDKAKGLHRNLKIIGGSRNWSDVLEVAKGKSTPAHREIYDTLRQPAKFLFVTLREDVLVYKGIRRIYLEITLKNKQLKNKFTEKVDLLEKEILKNAPQQAKDYMKNFHNFFTNSLIPFVFKLKSDIKSIEVYGTIIPYGLRANNKNVYKKELYAYYLPFFKFLTSQSINKFWVYHSAIEFAWTIIPCLILIFVSVPSFALALALDENFKPQLWVKVIGNQWFWVYEYSTYDEYVVIDSVIQQGSDLKTNALRLLAPDTTVTIPYNKFVRFLVTSVDVIHSWAVPALGVKVDACPGRINSVSILPNRLGIFYGQCSEICGVNHAFMPIAVEVVA